MAGGSYIFWDDASPEERILRWKKGIEYLESLEPHERTKHFRMDFWGYKNKCGTVACAAGHLGLFKWFRDRGLRLKVAPSARVALADDWTASDSWPELDPDEFFGTYGADAIFYNGDKRTMKRVIAEMQGYLFKLKLAKGARDVTYSDEERELLAA